MGRQDRRLCLRRRRDGQLYVGDGIANSLMLDFICVIIPRFVFATSEGFDGDNIIDKKVVRRIETLADELVRFTKALRT